MKTLFGNEKLTFCELPMVRCCICGDLTSSWHSVAENLNESQISIEEALLQCFETEDAFWKAISCKNSNNVFVCNCCEEILLEFNCASQKMAKKRDELQQRLLQQSANMEHNEFIVIVEPIDEELVEDNQLVDDVKVSHLDEEFVKVDQPDEQFEDELSSDDSETTQDEEIQEELENWNANKNDNKSIDANEKPSITIERVSKIQRSKRSRSFEYGENKSRYCWRCGKKFTSGAEFENHRQYYHVKNRVTHTNIKKLSFKCLQCHKNFSTENALEVHITRTHLTNFSQWQCEMCTENFDSPDLFAIHNLRHKKATCAKCGKILKSDRALTRHMLIHSVERKFQCEHCNNTYQTKTLLQKHKLTHKTNRNFVCPVCDFTFCTAWNLKRHRQKNCLPELNRNKFKQL